MGSSQTVSEILIISAGTAISHLPGKIVKVVNLEAGVFFLHAESVSDNIASIQEKLTMEYGGFKLVRWR
jgi:hypothetical protein